MSERIPLVFPWPEEVEAVHVFFNGTKLWPDDWELEETLDGEAAIEFDFPTKAGANCDKVELVFDFAKSLFFVRTEDGWDQLHHPELRGLG